MMQTQKLLFVAAWSLSALSFAANNDLEQQSLEDLLSDVATLKADVVQLIVESNGGVLEESRIKMQLKKPDGFYWETIEPFPELIVTNGIKLWNYQPDLDQVVIEDWNVDESELAAQLLSGRTDNLQEDYTIIRQDTEDSDARFILTPIASDSIYNTISIGFLLNDLDAIHLNSKNGEQTVWQFQNVERNLDIDDSIFNFIPPADIDVIENSYVQ